MARRAWWAAPALVIGSVLPAPASPAGGPPIVDVVRLGRACAGAVCVDGTGGVGGLRAQVVGGDAAHLTLRVPARDRRGGAAWVRLTVDGGDVRPATGEPAPADPPRATSGDGAACVVPAGATLHDGPGGAVVGEVDAALPIPAALVPPRGAWHLVELETAWGPLHLWASCADAAPPDDPDARLALALLDAAGTFSAWTGGACVRARWSRTGALSGVVVPVDGGGAPRTLAWGTQARPVVADGIGAATLEAAGLREEASTTLSPGHLVVWQGGTAEDWVLDDPSCARAPAPDPSRTSPWPAPPATSGLADRARVGVAEVRDCADGAHVTFFVLGLRDDGPDTLQVQVPGRGNAQRYAPEPWKGDGTIVAAAVPEGEPVPAAAPVEHALVASAAPSGTVYAGNPGWFEAVVPAPLGVPGQRLEVRLSVPVRVGALSASVPASPSDHAVLRYAGEERGCHAWVGPVLPWTGWRWAGAPYRMEADVTRTLARLLPDGRRRVLEARWREASVAWAAAEEGGVRVEVRRTAGTASTRIDGDRVATDPDLSRGLRAAAEATQAFDLSESPFHTLARPEGLDALIARVDRGRARGLGLDPAGGHGLLEASLASALRPAWFVAALLGRRVGEAFTVGGPVRFAPADVVRYARGTVAARAWVACRDGGPTDCLVVDLDLTFDDHAPGRLAPLAPAAGGFDTPASGLAAIGRGEVVTRLSGTLVLDPFDGTPVAWTGGLGRDLVGDHGDVVGTLWREDTDVRWTFTPVEAAP